MRNCIKIGLLSYLFIKNDCQDVNKDLLQQFDYYMKEYVYDKIYSELSFKEQNIIIAFETNEAIKMNDLVKRSGIDIKTLSVYRDRLKRKGIIESPCYGYARFTLPRFNEYLMEYRF